MGSTWGRLVAIVNVPVCVPVPANNKQFDSFLDKP